MIHKDDFGNIVGTPADWEVFYKWAAASDLPYNTTLDECIEEYLKYNSNDNNR